MSINQNTNRVGNFNSSEIVALTKKDRSGKGWGAPALTFIQECIYERHLGRSISDETNARPLTWGKLVEARVFDLLGLDYTYSSQETDVHPTIHYWVGSKDGMKHDEGKTVFDIKCPLTLKSFCQLVHPLYLGFEGLDAMNIIRKDHKDGEKYYWQLVSNAIINGCKYAELIVYMPFESEIPEIKQLADGVENAMWIQFAGDNELPFIKDGGFYKNVNIIRFEVPQEDKDTLTNIVIEAGKMLTPVSFKHPKEVAV